MEALNTDSPAAHSDHRKGKIVAHIDPILLVSLAGILLAGAGSILLFKLAQKKSKIEIRAIWRRMKYRPAPLKARLKIITGNDE